MISLSFERHQNNFGDVLVLLVDSIIFTVKKQIPERNGNSRRRAQVVLRLFGVAFNFKFNHI